MHRLRVYQALETMFRKLSIELTFMLLVGQDLEDCANTLIGDETTGMKGISGGQRRRVGVGLQLVTNPRLIFLDEPTSGLDSEMAMQVMDTLRRLSRRDRLVSSPLHIDFFCHSML